MKGFKMKINLPNIVTAVDYHEFDHIVDTVNDLCNTKKIKIKEIGLVYLPHGPEYVCVLYMGNVPNKQEIENLLAKKGIKIEYET
jgi:hypothetical protein